MFSLFYFVCKISGNDKRAFIAGLCCNTKPLVSYDSGTVKAIEEAHMSVCTRQAYRIGILKYNTYLRFHINHFRMQSYVLKPFCRKSNSISETIT